MNVTKAIAMNFARRLMVEVRKSNPTFTTSDVITHTAEGTAEKFRLDNAQQRAVHEELELEEYGTVEY